MAHTIDLERELRSGFGLSKSWHERRAEAADVADDLASLPDNLRDLADALDACDGNLSDAARMLGLTRKKARLLLERLRQAFS